MTKLTDIEKEFDEKSKNFVHEYDLNNNEIKLVEISWAKQFICTAIKQAFDATELEDLEKTVNALENLSNNDFVFDMDCKLNMNDGRDKNSFTQEEAQEMARLLGDVCLLTHNMNSSCCRHSYDKTLERYLQTEEDQKERRKKFLGEE